MRGAPRIEHGLIAGAGAGPIGEGERREGDGLLSSAVDLDAKLSEKRVFPRACPSGAFSPPHRADAYPPRVTRHRSGGDVGALRSCATATTSDAPCRDATPPAGSCGLRPNAHERRTYRRRPVRYAARSGRTRRERPCGRDLERRDRRTSQPRGRALRRPNAQVPASGGPRNSRKLVAHVAQTSSKARLSFDVGGERPMHVPAGSRPPASRTRQGAATGGLRSGAARCPDPRAIRGDGLRTRRAHPEQTT